MDRPAQSFWATVPGLLTGIAALITAVTPLVLLALGQCGGPPRARGGGSNKVNPALTATVKTEPLGVGCPKTVALEANIAAQTPTDATVRWTGTDGWKSSEQVILFRDGQLATVIYDQLVISKPGMYRVALEHLDGAQRSELNSVEFAVACN